MKVLLDSCVWGGVQTSLAAAGHDVEYVGDWATDPGDEILARAYRDGCVLVTLDKDFGHLAVAQERPHHGIVRLVNLGTVEQVRLAVLVLEMHAEALFGGAIITAERGRLRVRLPAD